MNLNTIDEFESRGVDGYVPITPVLFTWMVMAPQPSEDKRRYLMSAALRLDLAQNLFQRVDELRQSDPEGARAVRCAVFELVGATELAVVSLSRAMDMFIKAGSRIGTTAAVPSSSPSGGVLTDDIEQAKTLDRSTLRTLRSGRPAQRRIRR